MSKRISSFQSADVFVTVEQIDEDTYIIRSSPMEDQDILKPTEMRAKGLAMAMEFFYELIDNSKIIN